MTERGATAGGRGRVMDVLTLVLLAAAVWVSCLPGSRVRVEVERMLKERHSLAATRANWTALLQASSPLSANASAPTIVEFAYYECPFCRSSFGAVDSAPTLGVRVVYVNYPIKSHLHAYGAALAAVCADAQGRFAEMHRQLMTTTEWLSDTNWIRQARVAGVRSIDEFQRCLQSEAARERLRAQRALADAIGVDGTPYFVNGRAAHRGAVTVATLDSLARTR